MDALELTALRLAVGEQPSEELPSLAAEALTRGLDSPSLRVAAGAPRSDVRDARDAFIAALDELGIAIPDEQTAMWLLVRDVACRVVAGDTSPYDGASWIWRHAYPRLDREGDLRIFVGLASECEDHPDDRAALSQRIIDAARQLLDRPELRRWVKVHATPGAWPLWQPHPLRCFGEDELPISEKLRKDLGRWAADFDHETSEHNSGPGGFTSRRAAARVAERGRSLCVRLQDELGEDWHVEYMPNPIALPPKQHA